jgi:hypothetical protein
MDRVWSEEFAQIVGPLVAKLKAALDVADDLGGLKVIIYADDNGQDLGWGFKFDGPLLVVNRAIDLFGTGAELNKTTH